jgi:hypothetical protein
MTMSKKDYELIASVLNTYVTGYEQLDDTKEAEYKIQACYGIASTLSLRFTEDSPRFLPSRFLTACGVK